MKRSCLGLLLVLVTLMVGTSGCMQRYYRLYEGPGRASQDIAIVQAFTPTIIHHVDGKEGPNFQGLGFPRGYNSNRDARVVFELLPGRHMFTCGYGQGYSLYAAGVLFYGSTYSVNPIVVEADLAADKTYEVRATLSPARNSYSCRIVEGLLPR